jgi:proteasome accessory factor C
VPERAARTPKTADRLARMLVVVPYFVQHPGTSLEEASTLFDVPADQLRKDLELLFLSGLPPYGPGDLIDVEIDEDDQVTIRMADHFARPLRLTRHEALALYLRGTELLGTAGLPQAPALRSALEKLRNELGPETLGDPEGRIEATEADRPLASLTAIREAASAHRRLRITYFAHSSGEWSVREIEPEEVFASMGSWYVAAWDVAADAERLFRVDRIREVEDLEVPFTPHGLRGAGRALYTPTEEDVHVRLHLRPGARWVAEYYAVTDAREADGGGLDVSLPVKRLDWVAGLLLRLGPDAEVLEPPDLRERVRDLARRTLDRYGD